MLKSISHMMAEVEQWAEEIKDRMQMCSCSLEEAYKDITQ